jgi:hypothetical protein
MLAKGELVDAAHLIGAHRDGIAQTGKSLALANRVMMQKYYSAAPNMDCSQMLRYGYGP